MSPGPMQHRSTKRSPATRGPIALFASSLLLLTLSAQRPAGLPRPPDAPGLAQTTAQTTAQTAPNTPGRISRHRPRSQQTTHRRRSHHPRVRRLLPLHPGRRRRPLPLPLRPPRPLQAHHHRPRLHPPGSKRAPSTTPRTSTSPSSPSRSPSPATDVEVTATRTEIAAAQIKLEEKQRVLGVFPNFYATYIWNAAPLTTRQKFGLAWKSTIDPVTIGVTGITAGIQQATNTFSGYGQGAAGYGKRFGAAYADGVSSTFLGGAIFPSLFHQDPRYFVMGHGTIRHRFLYAIATPVICRGDNYKWQPNYSNVLGNLTSAAISNAYYPASDRNGASLTITNSLIGTASGAVSSLIQEFFLHHITPKIPDYGETSTATPHPTTP